MTPHFAADSMDTVIKQRMQLHQSEFRSVFDCARTVYRNEGLFAFYVSYPTTLTMTIPFAACQFAVYERTKKLLNPKGEYSPVIHVVAGGMAGAVGAAVTTPLDVAKTLLQTRGTSHDPEIRSCRGMLHAFRIIWMRDGLRGFSRGLTPRVLTHMPSNALSWLSYEFFSASIPIVTQDKLINSLPNRGSNPRPVTNRIERVNNPSHLTPRLISACCCRVNMIPLPYFNFPCRTLWAATPLRSKKFRMEGPTADQAAPAALHHRKWPSSPPVTNALEAFVPEGCGRQDTLQTSPVSWIVETAVRADKSQTLIVLSADLWVY